MVVFMYYFEIVYLLWKNKICHGASLLQLRQLNGCNQLQKLSTYRKMNKVINSYVGECCVSANKEEVKL